MRILATEFEVDPMDRGEFVARVTGWVMGIKSASVFDKACEKDLDAVAPRLLGARGDELRLL